MNNYINIPGWGDGHWKAPVATTASLPLTGNNPGDVRVTLDTYSTYTWNGTTWLISSGGNAFGIIQTPFGTYPVADGHTDSLTFTSLDNSVVITGDATTDSVDFSVTIPASGITDLTGDVTATGPGSVAATVKNNLKLDSIGITVDGAGSAITTGLKGFITVPFACTITANTLLADTTGSIVFDIWKVAYSGFPGSAANSITAAAKPTISAAQKSTDSTLTGWTTSISAGDVLEFNVDSCSTITRCNLVLTVVRT